MSRFDHVFLLFLFFIASRYGYLVIVNYLIEKGFDGNIRSKNGSTALHSGKMTRFDYFYLLFLFFIASKYGHLDIVKYFIEKGFDGYIQVNNG